MQTAGQPAKGIRKNLSRIVALVAVIVVTALLVIYRDEISKLSALGYPGIFLASLLASATLILPAPGVLFTAAMGAVFNPFWVAVAAGLGAALGELTGYIAGYSGQAVVENKAFYERVVNWMRRFGDITILVLAFIPNPVFDVAGIAAGVLKMPVWRFLLWCVIGKIAKMMLFSYGGGALGGNIH